MRYLTQLTFSSLILYFSTSTFKNLNTVVDYIKETKSVPHRWFKFLHILYFCSALTHKAGYSVFKADNLTVQLYLFFFPLQKCCTSYNLIIVIQLHIMFYSPSLCVGVCIQNSGGGGRLECKQAMSCFTWCLCTVHVKTCRCLSVEVISWSERSS